MSMHGCILLQTPEGWRLAATTAGQSTWHTVHGGLDVHPQSLASEVEEFISSGYLPRRVAISLASATTMAASLIAAHPGDLRQRRLLGYQLEDSLPIAAEDFVADFMTDGQQVLGVAVIADDLLPVVTALESQGLQVQSISPTALQALQALVEFEPLGEYDRTSVDRASVDLANWDLIAWQNGSAVELFRVGRSVLDWHHLPAQASALMQHVGAELLRQGGQLRTLLVDCDREIQVSLEQLEELDLQKIGSASMAEQARRVASAVLSDKWKPWIELRRDVLTVGDPHRALLGAWRLCLTSVAVLLVAMTTFFWMRSLQYDSSAELAQDQQEKLFRQAFPETRVPAAVVSRLKSEHSKLIGARGEEAAVRLPPSALNVLHTLVTNLPDDVRLQVEQIRIEDGHIDVGVKVQSVGKAGQLADALQNHGFAIEPPTTEQRDPNTVTARIHGVLQRASDN